MAPDVYHVDYTHGFQDHRVNNFGGLSLIIKPVLSIVLYMPMKLLCAAMTPL